MPKKMKNRRPADKKTRAKRLSASDRKLQIIESAIGLFGKDGLKGTTTKALADAAGVSEGTIFKHFPTKEAVYMAAFEGRTGQDTRKFVLELEQLADKVQDEDLIQRVVRAILFGYGRDRDLHRMLLYVRLGQSDQENQEFNNRLDQTGMPAFVSRYIAVRQQQGVFVSGPPAILAEMMLGLPIQLATRSKLFGIDLGVDDETLVELLARLCLNGLRKSS